MHSNGHTWRFVSLILLCIGLMLLKMSSGAVDIPLRKVWQLLFEAKAAGTDYVILHQVRLPEMWTAILSGMGLSVAGLIMQTLFRNPLAGPSVLGLSAGASLGAAVVVLTGMSFSFGQVGASIIGSVSILILVLYASHRVTNIVTLLVFGLMLGYLVSAIVSILQFYARAEDIGTLVFWGMGHFGAVHGSELAILAIVVMSGLGLSFVAFRPLDAYLLGEEQARSLGVNVKAWRIVLILLVGSVTGLVTAYCGPLAFIGLAVPHMARLLFDTSLHGRLIPATALCGAIVALFADIVSSSSILPNGLPLNAVLSIIGAPMVIWLVMAGRRYRMQV